MVDRQVDNAHEVHEAQTPIFENMVIGVPPVFEGLTKQLDKIVEQPLLGPRAEFPAGTCNSYLERREIEADDGQQALHLRAKMSLEGGYRRRLHIEGSRRSSLRTRWERSEEL